MKAGIIAAGEGSRLKAEGITVPKPLIAVDGVPLIDRLLGSYVRCGITEVVCITNEYYAPEVKSHIDAKDYGIPVNIVVKTTPSSMHSLFTLAPYLDGGKFLLSTVDSVFSESDLQKFLDAGQSPENDGALAITDFIDDEKPLYVTLDKNKRILNFEKSNNGVINRWVTGGLYIFSPKIFAEMEDALQSGMERLRNFLSLLVQRGYRLDGFPFGRIVDIDHAGDIATAEELLRAHA